MRERSAPVRSPPLGPDPGGGAGRV
ncbi:hypothetical protein STRTUCAR8_04652, partial [Streptomyces turgidiscabies Car8]